MKSFKATNLTLLMLLGLFATLSVSAQPRRNLNNWFLAINGGTTFGHMDVRPTDFKPYWQDPKDHWGYIIVPEVSYHFTHGFGVVTTFTHANVRSYDNRFDRRYNTDLNEWKIMGHINLGKALSFNKRKNIISPYCSGGVGATWVYLNEAPNDDVARAALLANSGDTSRANTWNKNFQIGFYMYLTRFLDLDIKYNYTFYNEDFIDGASLQIWANREWDKYSSLTAGFRFKFGSNNKKTYEHTSWARDPMEEDTSMFNNLLVIEEYDDGYGNPVYKMRPKTGNINEEELTKIDSKEENNQDLAQAVYNTIMNNPVLKDSIMQQLSRDLKGNDNFILLVQDGVCVNCPGLDTSEFVRFSDLGTGSTVKRRTKTEGVANVVKERDPKINPLIVGENMEFQLKNIEYDLDKFYIREDASETLDELAAILKKYPTLKIELSSHTDCRQSKKYNLQLSEKRALAAVNYLVCQGIDRCRLVAKGYGEYKLINDCECEGETQSRECTEEEHQVNRRTMVKVLSTDYTSGSECQQEISVDEAARLDAEKNSIELQSSVNQKVYTEKEVNALGINTNAKVGFYVVTAISKDPVASLAMVKRLKAEYPEAGIFYAGNSTYYIYVHKDDTKAASNAHLKEIRCCTEFPDAWIHNYVIEN